MKTATSINVKITKKELFEIFKPYSLKILKKNIPEIEEFDHPRSSFIFLEKFDETFKLIFKIEIRSTLGGVIDKIIDSTLVFQSKIVIEMLIDKALEEKGVKKTVNLNTPIENLNYIIGNVSESAGDKEIISFDFSLVYDDPSDYK